MKELKRTNNKTITNVELNEKELGNVSGGILISLLGIGAMTALTVGSCETLYQFYKLKNSIGR